MQALESPQDVRRERVAQPVFSVCIPQHNRTSFIIEACRSLVSQTYGNFEVCISDDCSTDGGEQRLLDFLEDSELSFAYRRQRRNLRYDANLRAAIDLARGQYVFLMGNDDCLARPTVLEEVLEEIERNAPVSVAVTNFEDYASGKRVSRFSRRGIAGRGPRTAAQTFRNFSFVSGVVLEADSARRYATDRWDGSEMYQVFLAARLIAAGGRLLYIDTSAVRKDIQIAGENVDSYVARPRLKPCPVVTRHLPVGQLAQLVSDAITPCAESGQRGTMSEQVARQLYQFTYPFWILEYRRVQSWRYALGVCLGLRPAYSLRGLPVSSAARMRLTARFWLTSALALVMPLGVFNRLRQTLYRFAKSTT
ncbi:MAG: glycosyltransferase [Chloroflexi bacterium]|nr:glycosyltransferase [Chloroflexota bacterium]